MGLYRDYIGIMEQKMDLFSVVFFHLLGLGLEVIFVCQP